MPTLLSICSPYFSTTSASLSGSPLSTSCQPATGSFSQTIRPVVHASSSTPAGDRWSSTSSSKRVREEPSGPTSPAPTITTMSSGRVSISGQSIVGWVLPQPAGWVSASSASSDSSSVSVSASAFSRASRARAARSRSASPSPPVRSATIGATPADLRDSVLHSSSSSAAISFGDQVRTPASVTASTSGSL